MYTRAEFPTRTSLLVEADLVGKKLCIAPDVKAGVLDMDHLKSMTEQAGAKVTTRGCGKAPVRSNPAYLVTLFSNHAADIGPEPDGGKVRRVNAYRCRNIFRPVPRDGESAEGINLKEWIRKGNMSADLFTPSCHGTACSNTTPPM